MHKVNILILFFLTLIFNNLFAQTEKENIENTIQNYITGTSYNNIAQIEKAFYKDANLFLDNKDMSLKVVPISQYVKWYENKVSGEFNGRVGHIISIDTFKNIATAKAEILLPKYNLKFIDLFLLKKIKDEWKIISKTATSEKKISKTNSILFITSNASFYGNSNIPTGNSFSEIVNAYNEFDKAGYNIDFVSPKGGAIPLAYINTSNKLEKEYLYNSDFMYSLKNTLSPMQIVTQQYKAVYFVGGGSAMFGIADNEQIQKIAMRIYEKNNGIISSVCHGTAGIVNLKTTTGDYLIKDKKVSGYPDSYEKKDAEYYKHFPFKIQATVEKRGGNFKFSERNKPYIVIDGRLITGQNHLSSKVVALKIIESIEK